MEEIVRFMQFLQTCANKHLNIFWNVLKEMFIWKFLDFHKICNIIHLISNMKFFATSKQIIYCKWWHLKRYSYWNMTYYSFFNNLMQIIINNLTTSLKCYLFIFLTDIILVKLMQISSWKQMQSINYLA